jgi:hypothetical protein
MFAFNSTELIGYLIVRKRSSTVEMLLRMGDFHLAPVTMTRCHIHEHDFESKCFKASVPFLNMIARTWLAIYAHVMIKLA